VLNPNKRTKN